MPVGAILFGDGMGRELTAAQQEYFKDSKVRDAIRAIIDVLTGREKQLAQTAEGKLTAALEAAAKQAESLQTNQNAAQVDGETRFSYAGESANHADVSLLAQAKSMLAEGKSAEEIRRETGWFQGADGKWRFEIDDSLSHFVDSLKVSTKGDDADGLYRVGRLGDIFTHSELYKAYPALQDYTRKQSLGCREFPFRTARKLC